ncbi:serine/threonine protein kinase [Paracoccus caeni]|uniref:Serine/threonine protein kinase n=1 Tax=Paracoccus caeni TaxID=657651 RepID=A0A934VZ64_9RHOB|nr:serine/threonine-protein kinase [Paracoccus caeni]MBK4214968.1 serine/threonine protein kinase [Paracoccus caeni]
MTSDPKSGPEDDEPKEVLPPDAADPTPPDAPEPEAEAEEQPEVADRTVFSDPDEAAPPPADRTVIASDADVTPAAAPPTEATVISDTIGAAQGSVRLVEPGTLINNNYRIIELILAGGMGEVYRAENVFTGDPVAVKVILANLANDESVLDLFRREARVLVQLRDDAIVRYHNFILDGGLQRYCLIMEFVEGRHLGTRIKEDGPLPEDLVISLIKRLAIGLGRAHKRGVTHRDLSPDNVILRDDRIDEAVLIDFGIARSTELGDGLAGRFAGKFKYIAPEQLGHWEGTIGPWTDVYGLGLLIAMVALGKPLDMGDSVVSASAARLAIPPLDGVSHRLFPLLQHMLEPDPSRRPQDMAAVLRIVNDPLQLPAQYRLPLWETRATPGTATESGATTDTSLSARVSLPPGSLTGADLSDNAASHSPFASLLANPAELPLAEPAPEPKSRKGLIFGGLAALLLAGGIAVWALPGLFRDTDAPPPDEEVPVQQTTTMVPRDISTREGFLADQPMPSCTFATRLNHGPNAGQIAVLANGTFDATPLIDTYDRNFGTRPAVISNAAGDPQCAVVDFLREVAGRPATPPTLTANVTTGQGAFQLQGSVTSGGTDRNLWLFLVSPAGGVYDLTGQLQGEGAGPRRFGVSIQGEGGDPADAGYLLVALTSAGPLASVTAAPSGAAASDLLPRVLEELNANAESPGVDFMTFSATATEPASD